MIINPFRAFVFSLFSLLAFVVLPAGAANDRSTANEFREKALFSQKNGDYKEAYFYYTRALVFDTTDSDLFNETGLMAEASGNGGDAESYYKSAIKIEPVFLPSYYNLGALYLAQRKYPLAAYYLKQRVDMGSPRDEWTLRAQEILEEVYDFCPELNQDMAENMTQDLEKDLERQKIIERQEMETRKLMDIEEVYNSGTSAFRDGDYWLAVRLFEETLAFDPGHADAKKALGRARAQVRRQNAAAELDMSVQQNRPAIMDMYLNESE